MAKWRLVLATILISAFGFWLGGQWLAPPAAVAGNSANRNDKTKSQKESQPVDGGNTTTTPEQSDGKSPAALQPASGGDKGKDSSAGGGQSPGSCPQTVFFFIPTWYEFLSCTSDAGGQSVNDGFQFPDDIVAVAAAFTDMLVRIAGLVAVVAVIMGGVGYITAGGSPEKTASARRRIFNALIGLAIVAVASAFIRFIGNRLGGP